MNLDIPIIYDDKDIAVINKPSGLITHPKNGLDQSESVSSWAVKKWPEMADVHDNSLEAELRPGIVHRLDKETSGLIIIAKNQKAFKYFKNLFQTRQIKKTYLALVYGQLKNKKGRIELPLGKIGTKQTIRLKGKKELRERAAITDYEVIQEFPSYSLLQVYPQTGRTHQIRIHLKSIGHPLVCDSTYGGKNHLCPVELGRLFLHAQKLEFKHLTGQNLVLEVDPPDELTNFLKSSNISF